MKKSNLLNPNKVTQIIKNGTVRLEYPEHFTLAQCGMTSPGGAKLNLPNYIRGLHSGNGRKRSRTFIN